MKSAPNKRYHFIARALKAGLFNGDGRKADAFYLNRPRSAFISNETLLAEARKQENRHG